MTNITALEQTIKHWTEDYRKLDLFGGPQAFGNVFEGPHCPLCWKHRGWTRSYDHADKCGACVLKKRAWLGCVFDSPWDTALRAYGASDIPGFMRARRTMLRRLKRALLDGEIHDAMPEVKR